MVGGAALRQTPITLTSDTSWDLSAVADIQRVEIAYATMSTTVSADLLLRIGTGGTLKVTGYDSDAANPGSAANSTTGFRLTPGSLGSSNHYRGVVTLVHLGGNVWAASGTHGGDAKPAYSAGQVTLTGALNIVGFYISSGAFDAGVASCTVWT